MLDLIENKSFKQENYTENPLPTSEYDSCSFSHCDFSSSDLSDVIFSDCRFDNCNLSMVNLTKTILRDVEFKECKILGVDFEVCNPFGIRMSFEDCVLNHSLFYKTNIKKTTFKGCLLHEVEFSEADLSSAVFENCDLERATFENTILEKVDFRTAYNFIINPEINRIKKAKFSKTNISGLLASYDISIES